MSEQEILEDFDYLTQDDIRACFAYAADAIKDFAQNPELSFIKIM